MTLFKKNLNLTMFWQFSPLPLTLKKTSTLEVLEIIFFGAKTGKKKSASHAHSISKVVATLLENKVVSM